jgi:hypothetical protein
VLSAQVNNSVYSTANKSFKDTCLPVSFDMKSILKISDIPQESLQNELGSPLRFHAFSEALIKYLINFDESEELTNPQLYPVYKISVNDLVLYFIYYKGGAGGSNDEFYLAIYSKDGIYKSSLKIGVYNADLGGSYIVESNITKDLTINQVIKEYKSVNDKDKLISKKSMRYRINSTSGEITIIKKRNK